MLKDKVRRAIGEQNFWRLKKALGRAHLDEVRLVYEVYRKNEKCGFMIDVGAHFGTEMAMFVELGWSVLAFEPDDKNRKRLQERFGSHPRVRIDPRAVSDKIEEGLAFFGSDVSTGISGLSSFHESHEMRQRVNSTTLASAVKEFGIHSIDFVKTDIEGYDLLALKGIDWEGPNPSVVVSEFENRKTEPLGHSLSDMCTYLGDRGYRVTISEWHPIVEYGGTHRWKRFTENVSQVDPAAWGNTSRSKMGKNSRTCVSTESVRLQKPAEVPFPEPI
jgi:FkbM family methyltransferase